MAAERSLAAESFELAWTEHAIKVEPGIWKILVQAGYTRAVAFDAVSDLNVLQIARHLDDILARAATVGELAAFRNLVQESVDYSSRKRRCLIAVLDRPGLRCTVAKQTEVFTQREVLVSRIAKLLVHYSFR
jgi:hypothetical protein